MAQPFSGGLAGLDGHACHAAHATRFAIVVSSGLADWAPWCYTRQRGGGWDGPAHETAFLSGSTSGGVLTPLWPRKSALAGTVDSEHAGCGSRVSSPARLTSSL